MDWHMQEIKERIMADPLKFSFYAVLIFSEILILILGLITGGQAIKDLLFEVDFAVGTDYFQCLRTEMNMGSDIYPPLAQLFYLFLGQLSIPTENVGPTELMTKQMGFTIYSFYVMFVYLFLYKAIKKMKKGSDLEKTAFFVIAVLTIPFLYGLERGNIIYLVLIFVLLFVNYYDSESKTKRILAYVCLGIAAGLKIYPAVFGLLVLRRADLKETLLCIAIGAFIFLAPFLLSNGSVIQQIENVLNYAEESTVQIHYDHINMENMLMCVFSIFKLDIAVSIVHKVVLFIGFLGVVVSLFNRSMENWKIVACVMLIAVLCFGFRPIYALIFLLPPMILFMDSKPELSVLNIAYVICFLLMFIPMPQYFMSIGGVPSLTPDPVGVVGITTILEGLAAIAMFLLLIAEGLPDSVKNIYRGIRSFIESKRTAPAESE